VTLLDALILVAAAMAAVGGFRRGFLVGALALAGFAGGVWLATQLGKALIPGASSAIIPLVALVCGFVGAAALAALGTRLRARWTRPAGRAAGGGGRAGETADRMLGAGLSAAVALGVAWLVGALALQPAVPAAVRSAVRESLVLARINAVLPPPGPILAVLPQLNDIPRLRGPSADVAAPLRGIARDPDVRAARASVLRIIGTACEQGMSGSGWVAERGMVVTNAHVIAGQADTHVQTSDGSRLLQAVVVAFDRRSDVAVLRVPGLEAPALGMGDVEPGTAVAMLGFPEGGPYRARAARLGETRTLFGRDAEGGRPSRRSVTLFRAAVRRGNSGGPLIDRAGRVAGTVFAARSERRSRTGFAVPNEAVSRVLAGAGQPVSTGECAVREATEIGRSAASRGR